MSWNILPYLRRILAKPAPKGLSKSYTRPRGKGLDAAKSPDDRDAITRYPPWDKGIPVRAVSAVLSAQQDRIDRIFRTAGVSQSTFDQLYMPVIENVASYVHLLPATADSYFRGTGGLFRFALDLGLNTLQSAQAAVFPIGGGVEQRHAMLPRWALAAFIAGMCCQAYRTINAMVILESEGKQWAPLLGGLYPWANDQKIDTYYVRWIDDVQVGGAQASAAYMLGKVIPHEILSYLAEGNNVIIPTMTAAVTGVESYVSENPITRLVAPMVTRVIEEDMRQMALNYGHLVIGAHLEPYLLDAMRQLIRQGKWPVNSVMMPLVWVGKEGTFIQWQTAANDMATLLTRQAFTGIPRDPETMADLLVKAGIAEPKSATERYWTIILPNMEALDGMLKLKVRNQIFPAGYKLEAFDAITLTSVVPTPTSVATQVKTTAPAAAKAVAPAPAPSNAPRERPSVQKEQKQAQRQEQPKSQHTTPKAQPKSAGDQATQGETQLRIDLALSDEPMAGRVEADNPAHAQRQKQKSAKGGKPADKNRPGQSVGPKQSEQIEPPVEYEPPPPTEVPESYGAEPDLEAPSAHEEAPAVTKDEVRQSSGTSRASMLASLEEQNAFLLGEILTHYDNGTCTGVVRVAPQGFCIDHLELTAYGIAPAEMIVELTNKHWLYKDLNQPSKRLHAVDFDGATGKYLIIKPEIAAALGVGAD